VCQGEYLQVSNPSNIPRFILDVSLSENHGTAYYYLYILLSILLVLFYLRLLSNWIATASTLTTLLRASFLFFLRS
jgi:hypothetical protein